MSWDTLGLLANGVLIAGLLPTVLNKDAKVPQQQAAITVVGLALLSVALFGVGAKSTAAAVAVATVGWLFILMCRRAQ